MSDSLSSGKPEAVWEPGTLDNTRRNIGAIDKEEALRMQKVLGGQILAEKSAPIDYSALPQKKRTYAHRASGKSASDVASMARNSARDDAEKSKSQEKSSKNKKRSSASADGLPEITQKVRQKMDRLMMSSTYKIKSDFGFFNFFRYMMKSSQEKVARGFIEVDIQNQIDHLQAFATSMKTLIQISPDSYKKRILTENEPRFRLLKTVGNWTLQDVKYQASSLTEHPENINVQDMVGYVKAVYRQCLTIYYLGESQISDYIKDIFKDLSKYPKAKTEQISEISKQAVSEWLCVYTQVIKTLYPLLMRMVSTTFEEFPYFFTAQAAVILPFLGLSKFDIQLPQKKKKKSSPEANPNEDVGNPESVEKTEEELQQDREAEERKKEEEAKQPGAKTPVVDAGLKLLEKLFPDAGFSHLEKCPDMYPYFEPIYDFPDGYNVLSESNPMQVTIILITILQDLFQGMRNVEFTMVPEENSDKNKESLVSVLNEWSVYKENLFEKTYIDALLHFVNQQYTQSDFKSGQIGKKIMTDVLWQTKYNFLPHFEFEQLLLEKPSNDSRYRPLCFRTDYLRKTFTELSTKIDEVAPTKGIVTGMANPWKKYKFDIPNAVSKRMDVLLGAKKPPEQTNATNANLVKYAMCIISVLDWWVNNKKSPAYVNCDSQRIYRISDKDGAPVFSVPLRDDQNRLFTQRVKAAAGVKAE